LKTNKLFRIEEFPYRVLEVQVDNRMKDKNYIDITNIIKSLMKDINKRIVCNKDGIVYTKCQPISFEILYESNKELSFNFAVNELDSLYFQNRLQSILPNATLVFRDDYIQDFKNSMIYKYEYEKHYMLSLNTKVSSIPSLLAIKKDLTGTDKILLQNLILPIGDGWKYSALENWNKIKKGKDITNRNNLIISIFDGVSGIITGVFDLLDEILEAKPKVEKETALTAKRLISEFSSESKTKTNNDGYKVDINSFIKTDNILQSYNLSKSIETCFKDMASDNDLILNKKKKIASDKELKRKMPLGNKNIMSGLELANLIKLPDGSLQKRFGIKSIKINQIDIPKECKKGSIRLGEFEYHGNGQPWYLPANKDIGCLPFIILNKMGGGKTTALLNIENDTIKANEGLVVFDYVRDCQTAKALIKMHPDIQIIRFDDINSLDNFSFPEIEILNTDDIYQRKVKANTIATEVKYLINSMATDTEDMSRIMSKYLVSACKIVFVHKNKSLKDVLNVLEIKDIRNKFIKLGLDQEIFKIDSREIVTLRELDKTENSNKIQGLLDRFSIITEDTLFGEMLDKENKVITDENILDESYLNISNINFVDIMDNQKPVVIMMPQDIFTNKIQKDVICTYYMSRIRLAMSRRKDFNKICRVIIDECHQIPNTMKMLKDTIAEPRKFGLSYIMAMHSFGQISKDIKEIFMDIGCHFMLLKGISKSGFDELKWAIGDEFEFEDMAEMDWKFGSLNLMNIGNEYRVFMSKLPNPLKDINGKLFIGD